MNILDSYLRCLSKYVQFTGRARRSDYWIFLITNMFIKRLFEFLYNFLDDPTEFRSYIMLILQGVFILPSFAVGFRRMHDVGKSGWFCIIPFYNLYLACIDSDYGVNKYGPNPKGIGNNESEENLINSIGVNV